MKRTDRIPLVPGAEYNLILISNPRINDLQDFRMLAGCLVDRAPDIQPMIFRDQPMDWQGLPVAFKRPTMTFSPGPLRLFRPFQGKVFQGISLGKCEEYKRLEACGLPVVPWALLTPGQPPDLTGFGPYVVVKPDRGGRGADVRVMRKGRVKWRPPTTDYIRSLAGESGNWIVQEFIYTGPWPVSYRVATLFGVPLWSWKVSGDSGRTRLRHRYAFNEGGVGIVASAKGKSAFCLSEDPEVLALARRAHQAFSDIPLLGVDILRDAETGDLSVIEVNAVGYTWHFSSPIGKAIQQAFGFDLNRQFDGRCRAARILAEKVRRHGC